MRAKLFVLAVAAALGMGGVATAQFGGRPPDQNQRPKVVAPPPVATDQVIITGVVTALGPEPDRVTIAYGAVDALNWPAGSTPFVVTRPDLLKGISVGQRVRFKIESAHIYEIEPVS